MKLKEMALELEELEIKLWKLSSLIFVTNEAVKEKQEPESFYAGALCLAADMARALEREMKELRCRVYEMPEKEERTDEN